MSKNKLCSIGLILLTATACVKSEIVADGTNSVIYTPKLYPVKNVTTAIFQQDGNRIRGYELITSILSERLTKCLIEKSLTMQTPLAIFGRLKINDSGDVSSVQFENRTEVLHTAFSCTDSLLKQVKFAEPTAGSDNYMVYIRINLEMKSAP